MMTETTTINKANPFGLRLQSAREAIGLEIKDAAAQLRLNEKIIRLLETDCYTSDLPTTFLRGYIRSYGKLLQIPEEEIKKALEPIQPKKTEPSTTSIKSTPTVTSSNYFVQMFTYLIVFALIGLVGGWWYTHSSTSPIIAEKEVNIPIEAMKSGIIAPEAVKSDMSSASVSLGAKTNEQVKDSAPSTLAANTAATSTTEHHRNESVDETDTDNDETE